MFTGVDPPGETVKAFENNLKLLDSLIGPDNKYLVPDSLTIADLSVLSSTSFLAKFDYDLSDYPNFKRWSTTLKAQLPYFDEIHGFDMKTEAEEYMEKVKAKLAAQQ